MELGKIFTVTQFDRSEQTTWIIDKFYMDFKNQKYDTIKLGWVLSVIDKDIVYPISLYIKKCIYNYESPCKLRGYHPNHCGSTFSSIKSAYAGRGFYISKCKDDKNLNIIYEAFLKSNKQEVFVELNTPICFKAQSSFDHNSNGFGRSSCYYIVGISTGEPFERKYY